MESGLKKGFHFLLLFLLALHSLPSWADSCKTAVIALGSSSDRVPVSREALLEELAALYVEGLNNTTMMSAFESRLDHMATREGEAASSLYAEIEILAANPRSKALLTEQRHTQKREEISRIHRSLEPFLQRLSREHRTQLERQLIDPGLVSPLITGEVEFSFPKEHWFEVGPDTPYPENPNLKTWVRFGPGDGFAVRQVPVTQLEYFLAALAFGIADPTPARFRTGEGSILLGLANANYSFKPNHPVESLSVVEIDAHMDRVSQITGASYDLPDGTEWEFAARAGSNTRFHFGEDAVLMPLYGWFRDNSLKMTHEVGQLLPNAFSLFDFYGNVMERTSSVFRENRLVRGGCYDWGVDRMKSHLPSYVENRSKGPLGGFRLKRTGPGYIEPAAKFTLNQLKPSPK
jgi:hypothetical protein